MKALCYSGPHEGQDVWNNYRKSAEKWFQDYGLEITSAFSDCQAIAQISSPEFVFFYALAHGDYQKFMCEPNKYCTADHLENYLKDRGRMGFAFLGNCWSHVKTGKGTTSYAMRKGREDVTTIGYYKAEQSAGWLYSLEWQEKLFSYLKDGMTFGDAFDEATADYPEIADMVRIAGNKKLTLEEAKKVREKEEEIKQGCFLRRLLKGGTQ